MTTARFRTRARHGPRRFFAVVVILSCVALAGACRFEVGEEENLEESIERMTQRMAGAWNAGDLAGVMAYYSEGATYVTPDGLVAGRSAIRARLAPAFAPGAVRDSLRLGELDVRTLPPLAGIVTGRYERNGATPTSGRFTYVVRRTGDGWRIVHDHSP